MPERSAGSTRQDLEGRTSRAAVLGGGLAAAALLALVMTASCGYLVANAWATCLTDAERYGFALMLSAPVMLLVNGTVLGLTCPLAIALGYRVLARGTRSRGVGFGRLVGIAAGAGIVAAVVVALAYLEPSVVYYTWASPEQLTQCVGHVPSWWFSWRAG